MNNYSILGLNTGATLIEIKAKFRTLSKQLHPDVNGGDKNKTDRFVIVLAAYEALLKGDSGEQKEQAQRQQARQQAYAYQNRPKKASYRFESIRKDDKYYLIRFHLENVEVIRIYGKNGMRVGTFSTGDVDGYTNLLLSFEDAKNADYVFECRLFDIRGNSAVHTYKVTPPKVGLFQKFKNLFK
jgi:curved DNA-binding protein CbpA